MHGVIAGAYTCKAQGRAYTYTVIWERDESGLQWSGEVAHAARRAYARGELPHVRDMDSGDAVRLSIAVWIEDYSRELRVRDVAPKAF